MTNNMILKFFTDEHLPLFGKKLLVAVSAGPDSMALLDMLAHLRLSQGFSLAAAHLDHKLRADSWREQKVLANYCQTQAIPLVAGVWPQNMHPTKGIEAAAREFRYRFLIKKMRELDADYLLTAHHGDDLLENILLKFIRSGNPAEMNSLQAQSKMQGFKLLRPLLYFSKQELLAYDQKNQVPYVLDASNDKDDTQRNRLRHNVIPLLKKENPRLLAHANNFRKEMNAYQQELQLPQAEKFLVGIRIAAADLKQLDPDKKNLIFSRLIWQHWRRQRQVRFSGSRSQVAGFTIIFYKDFYYLVKNEDLVLGSVSQAVDCECKFHFLHRNFMITTRPITQQLVGTFYASTGRFTACNKVADFLLKNGQHVKAKKKFAEHAVPAALRLNCITLMVNGRSVFTEGAYSNQVFSSDARKYYLYEL